MITLWYKPGAIVLMANVPQKAHMENPGPQYGFVGR
jgi:hypothetical protein